MPICIAVLLLAPARMVEATATEFLIEPPWSRFLAIRHKVLAEQSFLLQGGSGSSEIELAATPASLKIVVPLTESAVHATAIINLRKSAFKVGPPWIRFQIGQRAESRVRDMRRKMHC